MNNDELPVERGFPVRLVVSGLCGYVSATKWLIGMELADRGFVRTASSVAGPRRSP
jgi:DMSO/TMAO reductase YedYZ molybdopterin-dependent catalytic subunit